MTTAPHEIQFPEMVIATQTFKNSPLEDVAGTLTQKLSDLDLSQRIHAGQRVAITAGSRGVTDMTLVIKTIVARLKDLGAKPFIVPAMGSHGGATAEGQESILKDYGITEETTGAPIESSMEVVTLGQTVHGVPVYFDATAFHADHIVVVNRVKPHTDFEGDIESGLTKMLAIGLGKRHGAETYHNAILEHGYYQTFTSVVDVILEKAPVTLGIGIVENQLDQTETIGVDWNEGIPALDRQLLKKAKTVFPKLPFEQIDLLIVDEMGKDISGTGMDQNIIARTVIKVGTVPTTPKIRRIFVRDITPASHGTATGLANADFTTTKLINKIDRHATYTNCLCSCEPAMAAIPPYFDTDREAIAIALKTIGLRSPEEARVVHIKNTLHMEIMSISKAFLKESESIDNLHVDGDLSPLSFDTDDHLTLPW
jgi:hypothetical protein